ncbi:Ankyrin repeat protein 1 [Giardia muris]|uniref:Ankyrin repeat protein 1 n=1 Tax=Giardia muris TaxID=5742 RepID=A0A4Z1SM64_GIAMU|nr:Ankyrin repeat protein 1 [Giardia muris]|eukprot:TNJ26650.1 Ankyrin repeat protein 1 [Giardia muris]
MLEVLGSTVDPHMDVRTRHTRLELRVLDCGSVERAAEVAASARELAAFRPFGLSYVIQVFTDHASVIIFTARAAAVLAHDSYVVSAVAELERLRLALLESPCSELCKKVVAVSTLECGVDVYGGLNIAIDLDALLSPPRMSWLEIFDEAITRVRARADVVARDESDRQRRWSTTSGSGPGPSSSSQSAADSPFIPAIHQSLRLRRLNGRGRRFMGLRRYGMASRAIHKGDVDRVVQLASREARKPPTAPCRSLALMALQRHDGECLRVLAAPEAALLQRLGFTTLMLAAIRDDLEVARAHLHEAGHRVLGVTARDLAELCQSPGVLKLLLPLECPESDPNADAKAVLESCLAHPAYAGLGEAIHTAIERARAQDCHPDHGDLSDAVDQILRSSVYGHEDGAGPALAQFIRRLPEAGDGVHLQRLLTTLEEGYYAFSPERAAAIWLLAVLEGGALLAHGYSVAYLSALTGRVDELEDTIACLLSTQPDGWTPWHRLAELGTLEAARLGSCYRVPLEVGCWFRDYMGIKPTALMITVATRQLALLDALAAVEAGCRSSFGGYTALMLAAIAGETEAAALLADAELGCQDHCGQTALMHAARHGNKGIAGFLDGEKEFLDLRGWSVNEHALLARQEGE